MAVIGLCYCVTLWHMSIGGRVVLPVTFQEVDAAPHAKTGTDGDYQSLKNRNSRAKEFHNIFIGTTDGALIADYHAHKTRNTFSVCGLQTAPGSDFPFLNN